MSLRPAPPVAIAARPPPRARPRTSERGISRCPGAPDRAPPPGGRGRGGRVPLHPPRVQRPLRARRRAPRGTLCARGRGAAADPGALDLTAPLWHRQEVLAAGLRPAHGPAEPLLGGRLLWRRAGCVRVPAFPRARIRLRCGRNPGAGAGDLEGLWRVNLANRLGQTCRSGAELLPVRADQALAEERALAASGSESTNRN